jgi:hypothetical protein
MISSAQAFEVAHDAIAGKRYHDAPCDIAIERDSSTYTVTFSSPTIPGAAATPSEPTRVLVDAISGSVREVRNAGQPERNARLAGLISGKRAIEVGLAALRESHAMYDEHWTTTAILHGGEYYVTFPVPEKSRAFTERADYALQVWVDSRTGDVIQVLHAS